MIILTIRTDKPESEIGLFEDDVKLGYETWEAHRRLAETLHTKTQELLDTNNKSWQDIQGIVAFKGPGSFTGLRIGISTANAFAYSNSVPIIGMTGEKWLEDGLTDIKNSKNDSTVVPEYGSPPHITQPKK